jgi:hypothetical protein
MTRICDASSRLTAGTTTAVHNPGLQKDTRHTEGGSVSAKDTAHAIAIADAVSEVQICRQPQLFLDVTAYTVLQIRSMLVPPQWGQVTLADDDSDIGRTTSKVF